MQLNSDYSKEELAEYRLEIAKTDLADAVSG